MAPLASPSLAPRVFMKVTLPDGSLIDLGYVFAVPPVGADAAFAGNTYAVDGVVWNLAVGQPPMHVMVTLRHR